LASNVLRMLLTGTIVSLKDDRIKLGGLSYLFIECGAVSAVRYSVAWLAGHETEAGNGDFRVGWPVGGA